MLVDVIYDEESIGVVKTKDLRRLIDEKKIFAYRGKHGWIIAERKTRVKYRVTDEAVIEDV